MKNDALYFYLQLMLQKCENIDKLLRSLSKKNDLLSKDIKKAFDKQKRNTCKKSIQLVEYFKQQQNRRDHNVEFQQRNFSNPLVSRKILPFSSPVNCQIQQANCLRSGFRNTLDQAQRDQEYLGSYAQLEFTIRELKNYIFDKQQKICILEAQVQKLHLQLAVKEKLLDKIQNQNSKMQRQRNLSLTNISELDYKIVSSRLVDIQSHFLHEQLIHFLQELKQRLSSDIFSSFQEAQSQRWKHILAKSTHKFDLQQSLAKYQNTKNKQSGLLKVVQDKVQHLKSFFCNKLEEYLRELHQQITKQQSMLSPAQSSINLSIKTVDRCSNQKQTYEVAPFQLSSKSWLQNRPVCQNSIIIVAEGDEENGEAPADSTSKISENSSQAFMRSLKSLLQDYSYLDPPIREKQ